MADTKKYKILVEIDGKTVDLESALKKGGKATDEFERKTKTGLGSAAASVRNLIGAYVGMQTVMTAFRWAEHAAGVEEQRAVLDRLARQVGTTGDAVENRLVTAFDGLVSRADAVDVAVRGMNAGLSTTEMELMADAATKLADITGTEKEAFDALFSAILRGNDKALVATYQIDIDIAAAQERAGKGASEWAKKQEVLNAVLAAAEKKNAELGTGIDSNSDKMVRATANIANMKDAVSSLLVPALGEAADYVSELASQFDRLLSSEKQQASLVLIEKQEELLRVEKALADIGVKPGDDKSGKWQAAADAVAHYTRILEEAIGKERQSVIGGGGSKGATGRGVGGGAGKGAAVSDEYTKEREARWKDIIALDLAFTTESDNLFVERANDSQISWQKFADAVAGIEKTKWQTLREEAAQYYASGIASEAEYNTAIASIMRSESEEYLKQFESAKEQQRDGWDVMVETSHAMQQEVTSAFDKISATMTDVIFGDVQDAGDAIGNIFRDLVKSIVASIISATIAYAALNAVRLVGKAIPGLGQLLHEGGRPEYDSIPTRHGGTPYATRGDDIGPFILQRGEYIMKRSSAQSIGYPMLNAMNRTGGVPVGGGGGSVSLSFNITAMDGTDVERVVVNRIIPILRRESRQGRMF